MTASGGVPKLPPAMTRSAPRPTIFSVSTPSNVATTGSALGLRREVRDVLDLGHDAVARADGEQDLGRGRGQRHDLLRLGRDRDGRALIVGQGGGEGRGRRRRGGRGSGCGGAAVATATLGAADALGLADAAAPVHAPSRSAASAMSASRGRNGDRAGWTRGDASGRVGWSARASEESRDPSLRWVEGGVSAGGPHGPAYLSLEGSSMHRGVGDRTSVPGRGTVTVAGLCRNRTGFATTRRGSGLPASVAQARPERPIERPGRRISRR